MYFSYVFTLLNYFDMNGFDFVSKRLPDFNLSPWIDVFDLRKGQVLLAQGQTLGTLFYVVSGLLR
ncbi:MAG: hypothetical protein ACXIUD_04145 [Mongoliitalea sp.]